MIYIVEFSKSEKNNAIKGGLTTCTKRLIRVQYYIKIGEILNFIGLLR